MVQGIWHFRKRPGTFPGSWECAFPCRGCRFNPWWGTRSHVPRGNKPSQGNWRGQHPATWLSPCSTTREILHTTVKTQCSKKKKRKNTRGRQSLPPAPLFQPHFPNHTHVNMWSMLSCVRLFETPWTVARQAPLSMGFPRQEHWSELLFHSSGDLPYPGVEPRSPALKADSLLSLLSFKAADFGVG